MGELPGLTATVERNDIAVNFTSISLTREASAISWKWEIELPELINIAASDLWTIKVGFAGAEWTRVDNCPAENISGDDPNDFSTRRVSGTGATQGINDLREYCVPKTLVFVSPTWMQGGFPTLSLYENMIVYGHDAATPGYRYLHPRLPGKEVKGVPGEEVSDFICIVGPTTHHAIGQYLATLIGYDLSVNVPDIPLLDTMTIASGTKWGEAITGLFSIWGPNIEVLPAEGSGSPRIVVSDVLGVESDPPDIQIVKITNPAIVSTSFSEETGYGNREIVDHVIVTGRKSTNTTLHIEPPDYTPIEIPIVPLEWDKEIIASEDIDHRISRYTTTGGAAVPFGIPGQEQGQKVAKRIKTQKHIMRLHTYRPSLSEPEKYIPIEDETQFYNVDNTLVGKVVVNHYYSAGLKPISTVEKEYLYTNWPKQIEKDLHLLRIKTTVQSQFVKPLNQSQTSEFLEEMILFDWEMYDGTNYRTNPRSMADILRQDYSQELVETKPDSLQDTIFLLTHVRMTDIQREFLDILVKRDFDHALIPDKFRMQTQILENPHREKLEPDKSEVTFRAEFFDGAGKMIGSYGPCYHPPKTVHHDDIDNDVIAGAIAARVFARKNTNNNPTLTLKTPVFIPFQTVNMKVRIGAFSRLVNGETRTIAEADYVLKTIHEEFRNDGEGNYTNLAYDQVLTVRSKF